MFTMFYLFQVGVIAAVAVGVVAMTLKMLNFTTLDLTKYFGSLLTGQVSGRTNFIAGFVFHLLVGGILANIYLLFIDMFHVAITLKNALMFGGMHTIISGSMLPLVDRINPCVAQQTIKPMNFFASNYGITAVLTFVAGHMLFAFVVFMMLAR